MLLETQTLIAYFNANGNPTVSMGLSVQSGKVFVFVQTKLPSYSYSQYELTGITPGTWYKFALDASATSATIYMYNQKLTSISQTNIPATASVSVGMFWGNGAYTGNLYIDNVQIGILPPLALPAGSVRNYWTGGSGTVAVPSSTWPTGGLHTDSLGNLRPTCGRRNLWNWRQHHYLYALSAAFRYSTGGLFLHKCCRGIV